MSDAGPGLAGLGRPRLRVRRPGHEPVEVDLPGPGVTDVGSLLVQVDERAGGWAWSVAPSGDEPVAVDALALVWDAGPAGDAPRLFRNGYQSWSANGVGRLGVDEDPSRTKGARSLSRGMHHADPAVAAPGELRSELVGVLSAGGGDLLSVGFESGADHDGTVRARVGGGRVELAAEAFLGGAVLAPGDRRRLHSVLLAPGDAGSGPELLAGWAATAGSAGRARTASPFVVGWCSWYQYFASITEDLIRSNLARAADWPFDLFQVDDGYQAAIGDWLTTNERFPAGLGPLAGDIAAAGRTPGLWLAPFLAAPGSALAAEHPDWLARHAGSGDPLVGMLNEAWGGVVHVLDTTRPEVLAWLEETAAALVALGYPYLKLDFTYAPGLPGTYADPSRTPAQRVRAGMEAVRRGAGEDAFLLGCGLPLGAGIGVVDGMRIGPDVAPWWEPQSDQLVVPGYTETEPSTRNAWRSTLARSWQHRQLWINDPDCLMLRTGDTRLTTAQVTAWALAVGQSGGMALVSDDLALLDDGARRLLEDVVAIGRAVDDEARAGDLPRCDDLLDAATPTRLTAVGRTLVGEPAVGTAAFG